MPLMSEVKKTGKRGGKVGTFLSWTLAVLACLWVAWCCAIGPLYWFGGGLSDFGWLNVLYLAVAFAICFSIVVALVRFGHGRRVLPRYFVRRYERLCDEIAGTPTTVLGIMLRHLHDAAHSRPGRALHAMIVWLGRKLTRCTDCWWKLMLVFVIGWLWVPTTLLAAFGADIRSQIREFSWALNQWTGLKQPYIGFFSFVIAFTGLLLGVLSIISVLLALAVWLWGAASSREQRQASLQHAEQQLARGSATGAVPAGPSVAAANDPARPASSGNRVRPGTACCSALGCSRAGSCP